MDANDFFRGFFGFNRMRPDRFENPFHRRDIDEDGDFTDIDDSSDPFSHDGFPSIFQHMEDMFNSMFSMHSGFLDFPNLEFVQESQNPRDLMLKQPDCRSCDEDWIPKPSFTDSQSPQADIDLDDKIAENGIGILKDQQQLHFTESPKHCFFRKSVSSKIVRSGNGVVEEHHSMTDSTGKTVTKIRKSLGDKTYQVTTESDNNGVVEKKEDFINMDEKDILDFEESLKNQKRLFSPALPQPTDELQQLAPPPGDPTYGSIFKKLFGL